MSERSLSELGRDASGSESARAALARGLEGKHPAEVADLIESLEREHRIVVWDLLDAEARAELLTELHTDVCRNLIAEVSPESLREALAHLQADELADLEPLIPAQTWASTLARIEPDRRANLSAVRLHDPDTAGGLMDRDAVHVRPDVNLGVVRRYLRRLGYAMGRLPEHTDSLIVVDREMRLVGVLPLQDVVARPDSIPVSDVLIEMGGLDAQTNAEDVMRWFTDHDAMSAPVVNADGVLVGRITVDDVIDRLHDRLEQHILHPAGLDEDVDLFAPVTRSLRERFGWLALNLGIVFVAAWVIGRFENAIDQIVALAVLMPVVASMGGATGQQTLALTIRGLAMRQLEKGSASRLLRREAAIGICVGVTFSAVTALIGWYWYGSLVLGVVVGIALTINVIIGVIAGAAYPLLLDLMRIDPAVAGGVALTATTDILGFFVFLALAASILL